MFQCQTVASSDLRFDLCSLILLCSYTTCCNASDIITPGNSLSTPENATETRRNLALNPTLSSKGMHWGSLRYWDRTILGHIVAIPRDEIQAHKLAKGCLVLLQDYFRCRPGTLVSL